MSLMVAILVVMGILTLAVSLASVGIVSKQPDRRLWRYMDSRGLIKFENYNIMTTVEYVRLREDAMSKGRNWSNIVEGVAVIGTAESARNKVKFLGKNSRLLWRGLHSRKFEGRRIMLAEAESIISEEKNKRHN
jgi:hypothetical protein